MSDLGRWCHQPRGGSVQACVTMVCPSPGYGAAVPLFRTGDLDLVRFGGLTGVPACVQSPGVRSSGSGTSTSGSTRCSSSTSGPGWPSPTTSRRSLSRGSPVLATALQTFDWPAVTTTLGVLVLLTVAVDLTGARARDVVR